MSLHDAIFEIQDEFRKYGKEGTLILCITNSKISPEATFVSNDEREKLSAVNYDRQEGHYETALGFVKEEVKAKFTNPKIGDKFIIVNDDKFREIAHPSNENSFVNGVILEMRQNPTSMYPLKGYILDHNLSSAFSHSEIKGAYEAGAIEHYVEPKSQLQLPFDETLLKKGFSFTILNADRWRKEVGKGHLDLCTGKVHIERVLYPPNYQNETLSIRGISKSTGNSQAYWYQEDLVAQAFRNGIAIYEEPTATAKTIVIDDIQYVLTPVV